MGVDPEAFRRAEERLAEGRKRKSGINITMDAPLQTAVSILEDRESKLHDKIIDYCDSQWPHWKYIHARMDKKSTLDKGVSDFTIFMPEKRVLVIECKTADGKLSTDQAGWRKEMQMLGHEVHIVRSMEEFLNLCRTEK